MSIEAPPPPFLSLIWDITATKILSYVFLFWKLRGLIPTFMCLWAIYTFPGSILIFGCSKIDSWVHLIRRFKNTTEMCDFAWYTKINWHKFTKNRGMRHPEYILRILYTPGHWLINYINTKAICLHLTNLPVKGLCGRCLLEFID